jgi:transmembrane sensor
MERHARSKLNTQIYEEASEWFVECQSGMHDLAARRDFDRWLRKSPEHVSAYLEIAAIWDEGAQLDPAAKWDADILIAQSAGDLDNVIRLPRAALPGASSPPASPPGISPRAGSPLGTSASGTSTPSPSPQGATPQSGPPSAASSSARYRHRRPYAIAGSVAVLACAAGALIGSQLNQPRYSTVMGEQRSLTLADGSTVELNSRSRIRVHYTERERAIDLISGQALFHVAKDHTRPFIVSAGSTRVRALGTQFDVYERQAGTVVTVIEGRVAVTTDGEISSLTDPSATATSLGAGEQLTVTANTLRRIPHPNIAATTAWTQRQLVFDSASLAEVAEEFNRYNECQLIIEGSDTFPFHISGVFASTDPDSLVRFLRARPGIRVTQTGSEIRVTKIIPGPG